MTDLIDLLEDGARSAGEVLFAAEGERIPAGQLWRDGGTIAPALARWADRSPDGNRVGAVLTNSIASVRAVLGSLQAGIELCSLPIPQRGGSLEDYMALLGVACRSVGVTAVAIDDDLAPFLSVDGIEIVPMSTLEGGPPVAPRGPWSLVQFTSGTTGAPKGIRLDGSQVAANVEAVLSVVRPGHGWSACSWLPLSHDMGLVGLLFSSLCAMGPRWGADGTLGLMRPDDFVRRPASWMELVSEIRANLTAGPDFGFRLAARAGVRLAGLDLSAVDCCIVGAEVIDARTLDAFTDAFADVGFDSTAFAPAYGMAEAGVAVSMVRRDQAWRTRPVSDGDRTVDAVSCGPLLPGYECRIAPGPAGDEILVRGPSIITAYASGEPAADPDGWLSTRDHGALIDGDLHVIRRLDDTVVVRGRNLSAPLVEAALRRACGWDDGRVLVVDDPDGGLAVVAEERRDLEITEQRRRLSHACVEACGVRPSRVELLERGTMPRTTSGKVRRRAVRALLVERS